MSDPVREALARLSAYADWLEQHDEEPAAAAIRECVATLTTPAPTEDGREPIGIYNVTWHPAPTEDATLDVERLAEALRVLPPIPDEYLLRKTWVQSDWLPNVRDYAQAIAREYGPVARSAPTEDGWTEADIPVATHEPHEAAPTEDATLDVGGAHVPTTATDEAEAIAFDRTWHSGYAAGRATAVRSAPTEDATLDVERLTEEIDRHWLESEVGGNPAVAACSCGEWTFDALSGLHSVLEMGQHFRPFSEHIAASIARSSPITESALAEALVLVQPMARRWLTGRKPNVNAHDVADAILAALARQAP